MTAAMKFSEESRANGLEALGETLKRDFVAIPEDIQCLSELELLDHFKPTPVDYYLRKRLWELVAQGATDITQELLSGDFTTRQNIERSVRVNPYRFCWIMTPLKPHKEQFEATMQLIFDKMRKFVHEMAPSEKNIGILMQMFDRMANRAIGPVAHNVNIRSQQIPPAQAPPKDVSSIKERLAELEGKKEPPAIVDLDPT